MSAESIIDALVQDDDELPPGYMFMADGRVMGPRGGWLHSAPSRDGYLTVALYHHGKRKTWRLSRLICRVFHGPAPTPRHQAAHLNGDHLDNRACNLAWKTQAENEADKRLHGTHLAGERKPLAKLTVSQAREIREAYAAGSVTQRALALRYGVTQRLIWNVLNDRAWRAA